MRITIITVGSTGDVHPYVALGVGLQHAGFQVRIATHAHYEQLIVGRGLEFAPARGDPREAVESDAGQAWLQTGENVLAFVRQMANVMGSMMVGALSDFWEACEDTDAVVYSVLGWLAAHHILEKKRIPGIAAYLQPFTPTASFPPVGMPSMASFGWYNRLLYRVGEQVYWQVFRESVNGARAEALGLPPMLRKAPFSEQRRRRQPVMYGYSPSLLPEPVDWPDFAHTTGYWFLHRSCDWIPPDDLLRFLHDGPAPLYVGFGSMHSRQSSATTALVLDALRMTGQRGIVSTGWGGLSSDRLPDSVFAVESVPHDWLFPRMAAVIHHAGAGTTGAGLRAGIPTISVPHFGDQPFWARRIHRVGVGPRPIPRKRLTAIGLARAIETAVSNSEMRERAAAMGTRVGNEDGVGRAVELVSQYLGKPK
jgi:UDP:flavonoid glycosyltransferase YjiC (YdhE family)